MTLFFGKSLSLEFIVHILHLITRIILFSISFLVSVVNNFHTNTLVYFGELMFVFFFLLLFFSCLVCLFSVKIILFLSERESFLKGKNMLPLLPSENGYSLKGKNLLTKGAKNSYLLKMTPFQKFFNVQKKKKKKKKTRSKSQKLSPITKVEKNLPSESIHPLLTLYLCSTYDVKVLKCVLWGKIHCPI